MIVGIDLDNTIVDYTGVFHQTAVELGWLNKQDSETSKSEVKQTIIDTLGEDKWTELQGIVYGETIKYAKPYNGSITAIEHWIKKGYQICIISHKTKYPIIGNKLDFHAAAENWLACHLPAFRTDYEKLSVSFNPTISEKVQSISDSKCDVFIDDLKKVLVHPQFPEATNRILFDPDNFASVESGFFITNTWSGITELEKFIASS